MLYERRDIKRRHLIYHLDVTFENDRSVGGHLADLSHEGLLVITDEPLPLNQTLSLNLRMPADWQGEPEVALQAECRWSRRDVNPDYFANGLHIIEAPDDYLDTLGRLILEYGFHD